jgi:hypothetical protein
VIEHTDLGIGLVDQFSTQINLQAHVTHPEKEARRLKSRAFASELSTKE